MNIALWAVAGVLAAIFVGAGLMKATQPKDKIAANMPWAADFSAAQVKAIGVVEILGGVGLIAPAVTGIAPILTPLAATGLAVTMLFAAIVHFRRGENSHIAVNILLFALATFVAVMRFGPNAF